MKKIVPTVTSLGFFALLTVAAPAQADPRYYYGDECPDQNATAGAVVGAIIGGLIGSRIGHGSGNAAATVGGVVLGGVAGSAIARDIDCHDRPYAFRAYADGFEGPIGHRYEWYNDYRTNYGYFRPTREYRDHGVVCRDFREDRYIRGRHYSRYGSACRELDGNWHFR